MNKREKKLVVLSKLDRTFLSNLKGRLAKVLSANSKITTSEFQDLKEVCLLIDDLLINGGEEDIEVFKGKMQLYTYRSEEYLNPYVIKYIIPLFKKIETRRWGKGKKVE